MATQPKHTEQHFRQTGKFKPINQQTQIQTSSSSSKFSIQHFQRVPIDFLIICTQQQILWRIYLQKNLTTYTQQTLKQLVLNGLTQIYKTNNIDESEEIFFNASTILLERIKNQNTKLILSCLDSNCVISVVNQIDGKLSVSLYAVEFKANIDRDFTQEISIKIKQDFSPYYLQHKNRMLLVLKNNHKSFPSLQLADCNLEECTIDIEKQSLLIKNLSPRIIALKFQEQNFNKYNQPLLIIIPNKDTYQQILYRINRIKYFKYKLEDETKECHSFDNKLQYLHHKESKTTPDKNKNKPVNKISMLSTNAVDDVKRQNKKKIPLVQPRHLKISQRVGSNPKQSNLVPSQIDYPVSVKDQKQKQNPYLDQFENLLFEQQGLQQKQLALNDSFEQFEKKQHSEKNLQIMKELNKRKQKQTQQKKILDSLKQKIKQLINEQKKWINKNLQLKSQIKKLKNPQTPDQIRQIDQVRQKVTQLKLQQKSLMDQLAQIKKNNCIQAIVYGEPSYQQSSQSQRGKQKIFHSINNMNILNSSNFNPLSTSVRSNTSGNTKFPQPIQPIQPIHNQINNQQTVGSPYLMNQKNMRPNYAGNSHPSIGLYSSIPTQNIMQQSYVPTAKPTQVINNDYALYPQQQRVNMHNHNHQIPAPFTSAIFGSGRMCLGSPMANKKVNLPVFPTGNNNNKN